MNLLIPNNVDKPLNQANKPNLVQSGSTCWGPFYGWNITVQFYTRDYYLYQIELLELNNYA